MKISDHETRTGFDRYNSVNENDIKKASGKVVSFHLEALEKLDRPLCSIPNRQQIEKGRQKPTFNFLVPLTGVEQVRELPPRHFKSNERVISLVSYQAVFLRYSFSFNHEPIISKLVRVGESWYSVAVSGTCTGTFARCNSHPPFLSVSFFMRLTNYRERGFSVLYPLFLLSTDT
jgi:hypothetical protein